MQNSTTDFIKSSIKLTAWCNSGSNKVQHIFAALRKACKSNSLQTDFTTMSAELCGKLQRVQRSAEERWQACDHHERAVSPCRCPYPHAGQSHQHAPLSCTCMAVVSPVTFMTAPKRRLLNSHLVCMHKLACCEHACTCFAVSLCKTWQPEQRDPLACLYVFSHTLRLTYCTAVGTVIAYADTMIDQATEVHACPPPLHVDLLIPTSHFKVCSHFWSRFYSGF